MASNSVDASTRKVRRPEPEPTAATCSTVTGWAEPQPGQVLGQFRVEKKVGRGGMNSVFLARHISGGAKVAIKVPNVELAGDPDVRDRLLTEGRILSGLRHPNIVTLFDVGAAPQGVPWLVMEYLEGGQLALRDGQPMAVAPAVHLLSQLCEALGAAHARGVVHRDVKPDNVFVARRLDAPLTVKLLDFGIARALGDRERRHATALGAVVGTPDFMAPEQMMGEDVDGRADLYAAAVVGFWLLTAQLPFRSLRQKVFKTPTPVTELRPDVPEALAAALATALAPDPAQRFPGAQAMREALGKALGRGAPRTVAATQQLAATVFDLRGRTLLTSTRAVVVPGGAWLCTDASVPEAGQAVLVSVPGHDGFLSARVVSTASLSPSARASLPRGFLLEFARLETGARRALDRICAPAA